MPSAKSKTSAAESLAILSTIALASFVFAMLYFARAILIPLALAALLTFLLQIYYGMLIICIPRKLTGLISLNL